MVGQIPFVGKKLEVGRSAMRDAETNKYLMRPLHKGLIIAHQLLNLYYYLW